MYKLYYEDYFIERYNCYSIITQDQKLKAKKANEVKGNEIVKISNQIWMVKNLNISRFRNGDVIPEVITDEEWIKAGDEGKPAWCYFDNNPENENNYGKLYNWHAVNDKRGLAPNGWHIPSKAEFETLAKSVNNFSTALKSIGQGSESGIGIDTSKFSALLAGYRWDYSTFHGLNLYTGFWSSSDDFEDCADTLFLNFNDSCIYLDKFNKDFGLSVRCIKD